VTALDLNLLRVLVALDDVRNVSRAAERLQRSQPAVSAALAKLRAHFGDALFVRGGNAMQPTPRATVAAAAARAVLRIVNAEIVTAPAFDPATSSRPVTLALSDVGEIIFLPQILRALRERMPQAAVRSVSMRAEEVASGLAAGEIDLALGYFPDLRGPGFLQQALFRDSFACLIRAKHPVRADRLTLAQFSRLEHAVVRVESRSEEVMEQFLARRRIARRVVLTTPHFTSVSLIVAQSDLVVTVPYTLARFFAQDSSQLRVVGLPFEPPTIELRQFWHRRQHDDARSRWLRRLVYELFATSQAPVPRL
jgi:DNA-binding transcriptional LysR family regulator